MNQNLVGETDDILDGVLIIAHLRYWTRLYYVLFDPAGSQIHLWM